MAPQLRARRCRRLPPPLQAPRRALGSPFESFPLLGATLDEDLTRFPYVNGDLFKGHLRTFSFDTAMLDACRFDWSNISPAIYGALFQSVMDPTERSAQGAHYTTEKNILKVIEPLFMDDLRAEFGRLRARKDRRRVADLRAFQTTLSRMTFFDPACGSGNFLIIAYPTRYNVEVIPTAPFLVVPKVSSERREYVPVGWLEPPTIPSDLVFVLQDASLADFALLTSAMHMAWLRHFCGRLKSDYRYSIGLVYNTFPMPPKGVDLSRLEPLAQADRLMARPARMAVRRALLQARGGDRGPRRRMQSAFDFKAGVSKAAPHACDDLRSLRVCVTRVRLSFLCS